MLTYDSCLAQMDSIDAASSKNLEHFLDQRMRFCFSPSGIAEVVGADTVLLQLMYEGWNPISFDPLHLNLGPCEFSDQGL